MRVVPDLVSAGRGGGIPPRRPKCGSAGPQSVTRGDHDDGVGTVTDWLC